MIRATPVPYAKYENFRHRLTIEAKIQLCRTSMA
jgi:hypothetical protein